MRKKSAKRKPALNNNIKKVLVPLDGSKNAFRALKEAIKISKKNHSKITGLYVISLDVSSLPITELLEPLSSIKPIGYKEQKTKQGKKIMLIAKEQCKLHKIVFSEKILMGNPGDQIIKFSHKRGNKFDWIIMGSRGMSQPKEIFLGSVSDFVIRKSKIPVLIVK